MGAFVAGAAKLVATFLASKAIVAVVVKTILINVALGAVSKALTKKPRQDNTVPAVNVTVKGAVENRRIILGTRRVGGVIVFYGTSGTNNEYLWYVIALAGHQCSDIRDVWLDTVQIADANINASTGAVTQGTFTGALNIWRFNGTSAQTVQTDLDSAFSQWTSNHRLRGCPYMVVRMLRSETAYPTGAPQNITALVDGALLYDPRLDSTNGGTGTHRQTDPSTWAFSRNPVLALRWYMTGGSVINDLTTPLVRYGMKEPSTRIDEAFWRAAANVCDESVAGANAPPSGAQTRYLCDLEATTAMTRRQIIEHILSSMAGRLVNVRGKWRVYAGSYDTPLHALTQDDLYGPVEVQDTTSHGERYNAVAAVYPEAISDYIDRTTIFRTDAAYEAQDNDEFIPTEIDLRAVTDQYQAQRLAEIHLRRSRMMRTVKIVGALNLLDIALHDNIVLSHNRYGWENRVFRVTERQFEYNEEAGRVTLTLQQESPNVYTDMLTADYVTGTSDTDQFQPETPEAPTALTITGMRDGMMFSWTLGTFWQLHGIVELWRHSSSTPFASASKIWEGRGNSTFIAQNSLTSYYYWIRIRTINGQTSATYPTTTGQAGVPLSLTQWVASGNCIAGGAYARKVGGSNGWDSAAYSIDSYATCHVQFIPDQMTGYLAVGLNTDPASSSNKDSIDYAFYLTNAGDLYYSESGTEVSFSLKYTTSTVLAITYDGSTIRYIRDGIVIRSVSVSSLTLFADSSFYTADCSVSSLGFGPGIVLADADNTMKSRVTPDAEFSRATDQSFWLWGAATGISISLTGGVTGGACSIVGNGTGRGITSISNPPYAVITGQVFRAVLRWRRTGTIGVASGGTVLQIVGYTVDTPNPPSVTVASSGTVNISDATISAATVNEWQETQATLTCANSAKNQTQQPYFVAGLVILDRWTSGTIEIDALLALPN